MRVARAALVGLMVAGFSVATKTAAADMTDMRMDGTTCTWGVALSLSAQGNKFDKDCLSAPPGQELTIVYDNKDAVAHNLVILPAHDSTEKPFRGEVIAGPGSVTYSVGPMPMGAYHFHCEGHPTGMMGKFVAGGTETLVPPGGMAMSSPGGETTASPMPVDRTAGQGSVPVRNPVLFLGIALGVEGVVLMNRSRRPKATFQPEMAETLRSSRFQYGTP